MDIRNYYSAQLGKAPYGLYNHATGELVSRVTENFSDPYYLTWFGSDTAAGFDVRRILPLNGVDHFFVIGDHTCKRAAPSDPWITTEVQDYVSNNVGGAGCPMFPVNLNPGDTGVIESNGRWTWTEFHDDGTVQATGSGSWVYRSTYNFAFDRFIWEELDLETHDDTGLVVPYHRVHQYALQDGWLGFKDMIAGGMGFVVRENWIGR